VADAPLSDLIGADVRLLFVGINPGLRAAATNTHFAGRGNRFYPALFGAGITDRPIAASTGLAASDIDHLLSRGVGITALVARATASAAELDPGELVAGVGRLREIVASARPRVVAILGVTAYRAAFREPRATTGRQHGALAGAQLWVVPNPSGRNAHASVHELAESYRAAAVAAGIEVYPRPAA
jgi:TDG/mug DNA glycosylase family protein